MIAIIKLAAVLASNLLYTMLPDPFLCGWGLGHKTRFSLRTTKGRHGLGNHINHDIWGRGEGGTMVTEYRLKVKYTDWCDYINTQLSRQLEEVIVCTSNWYYTLLSPEPQYRSLSSSNSFLLLTDGHKPRPNQAYQTCCGALLRKPF